MPVLGVGCVNLKRLRLKRAGVRRQADARSKQSTAHFFSYIEVAYSLTEFQRRNSVRLASIKEKLVDSLHEQTDWSKEAEAVGLLAG